MEKIHTADLKIGMYVILPKAWFSHPFLKNEFIISSESQIEKILAAGIRSVFVDSALSVIAKKEEATKSEISKNRTEQPVIPPDLREAIYDKKKPPEEKARAVQKHSITMMNRLMEMPSAENIVEAKKGIAEVVNLILSDDKTNSFLLSLTSHDYNTYVHSVNVGVLAVSLSKKLFIKSNAHNMHELGAGFFLHDLGKVRIKLDIINKPDKLTEEEMQQMRLHPLYGYEILRETRQLTEECKRIVLQHHERYNGTGYPKGLQGEEIHLYGRICSLADVYDALNSERPYRHGLKPFDALNIMKYEMLEHFHRELFEKFVLLFK